MGFPKIRGTPSGGPRNKDCTILGSVMGSHDLGKLPNLGVNTQYRIELNSSSSVHGFRVFRDGGGVCALAGQVERTCID